MSRDRPSRLTRRRALKGLGSVAATTALAGCGAEGIPGNDPGETLRYAQVLSPLQLDPVVIDDPWSAQAASLVFQGLYEYDRNLNRRPVLAAGPPSVSDDGLVYTVDLVEDATFHDGSSVTADDVRYTFEATTAGETRTPNAWATDAVESIRTPDERTVEFRLRYPYPAFGHSLTQRIVPKGVREDDPAAFGTDEPVGSGPFTVHVLHEGSYAVLERWPEYWGPEEPAVDAVKFVTNDAGFARTMSLKTGQNDVVERIEPKLWRPTDGFPGADVVSTESYHSFFLGFNCSDEPLSDPRVREAVDYLFSMDRFVEEVVAEAGRRQHSPLPRRVAEAWGFPVDDWQEISHRRNLEKAKALLEEAGVTSWSPKVAVPHDTFREMLAEAVVHELRGVGFRHARVVKYDWREFRDRVTTGNTDDYSMFVGSWAGFPDPDTFLYPLFHENMQGITNGTFYNEQSVMEDLRRARRTRDRARRKSLYESAITTLLEDRVHLPAFTLHNSFGVKERVNGFRPHPLSGANPRLVGPGRSVSIDPPEDDLPVL